MKWQGLKIPFFELCTILILFATSILALVVDDNSIVSPGRRLRETHQVDSPNSERLDLHLTSTYQIYNKEFTRSQLPAHSSSNALTPGNLIKREHGVKDTTTTTTTTTTMLTTAITSVTTTSTTTTTKTPTTTVSTTIITCAPSASTVVTMASYSIFMKPISMSSTSTASAPTSSIAGSLVNIDRQGFLVDDGSLLDLGIPLTRVPRAIVSVNSEGLLLYSGTSLPIPFDVEQFTGYNGQGNFNGGIRLNNSTTTGAGPTPLFYITQLPSNPEAPFLDGPPPLQLNFFNETSCASEVFCWPQSGSAFNMDNMASAPDGFRVLIYENVEAAFSDQNANCIIVSLQLMPA